MFFRMNTPHEAVLGLQRALERARASNWLGNSTTSAGAYPPVNVFRRGDDLVVVAEAPGTGRDSIDIEFKDRQLRLRGTRAPQAVEGASVHRRERAHGTFDRTLTIPMDVDADGIRAEYRDGILAVYLPRPESEKPRTITIE